MSQLLQIATRRNAEAIDVADGFGVPLYFDQGIPYDEIEGGQLGVATQLAGVIDHYHQGLPFTAQGRLAVTNDKPVEYYGSGAAPFDAGGLLVLGSTVIDHYSAGIPYTADGQIAVNVLVP